MESSSSLSPETTTPQTRQRLLEVAERLFSEGGFAVTSVRDITAAAGVNVAAVNYHFGGKENLYREVFRRRLATLRDGRLAAVRDAAAQPDASLDDVVRGFMLAVLEPFVDVQQGLRFTQLVVREFVDPRLEPGLCHESFAGYEAELSSLLERVVPGLTAERARLGIVWMYGISWQIVFGVKSASTPGACAPLGCSYEQAVERAVRFVCAGLRAEA